jgi:hypothetical protein
MLPRWRTDDSAAEWLAATATASLQRVQHARILPGVKAPGWEGATLHSPASRRYGLSSLCFDTADTALPTPLLTASANAKSGLDKRNTLPDRDQNYKPKFRDRGPKTLVQQGFAPSGALM